MKLFRILTGLVILSSFALTSVAMAQANGKPSAPAKQPSKPGTGSGSGNNGGSGGNAGNGKPTPK